MGKYHLFEGYGIEVEFMIVHKNSLKVAPMADVLLDKLAGEPVSECFIDGIGFSNELVKHVIELKTDGPAESFEGLSHRFHRGILRVLEILEPMGLMIMPTAMHPTMDPSTETKLWQDENKEIYECYDRIFNCKGHGWANLQSIHINLPFSGDEEFGRLHAAVRAILPILPALASSSPIVEGVDSGLADNRLEFYRKNQKSVPEVAGKVIPEKVFTEKDYNEQVFDVIAKAIAPHDPDEILEPIWLNSRGAIARFDRGAVEIRLLDVQECPDADIAVAKLVSDSVKLLCNSDNKSALMDLDESNMLEILLQCIKNGENTLVTNEKYLKALGMDGKPAKASKIWKSLFIRTGNDRNDLYSEPLINIFSNGTLSTRIRKNLSGGIEEVYSELCRCVAENKVYNG